MNRLQASLLGLLLCYVALTMSSDDTERPGECPPQRVIKIDPYASNYSFCQNDSSCPDNQKCCLDNNYKVCKPAAEERSGSCPSPPPSTSGDRNDKCSSDSECASGAKCCLTSSGKSCTPSFGEKKGFCKNPIYCFRADRSFCDGDTGCPYNQKCCQDSCGDRCMPALKEKPGTCPPKNPGYSRSKSPRPEKTVSCSSDKDCEGLYKCCDTMKGNACTVPDGAYEDKP